jgi:hypothetical protein
MILQVRPLYRLRARSGRAAALLPCPVLGQCFRFARHSLRTSLFTTFGLSRGLQTQSRPNRPVTNKIIRAMFGWSKRISRTSRFFRGQPLGPLRGERCGVSLSRPLGLRTGESGPACGGVGVAADAAHNVQLIVWRRLPRKQKDADRGQYLYVLLFSFFGGEPKAHDELSLFSRSTTV